MAQGDGTHRLSVKAALRKRIGKEAGDTVHIRIDERIGCLESAFAAGVSSAAVVREKRWISEPVNRWERRVAVDTGSEVQGHTDVASPQGVAAATEAIAEQAGMAPSVSSIAQPVGRD